jgi:methionyl-tRNA formyltransferase
MRLIFFGTPWFAAEVLRYLVEQRIFFSAVVTQPDRPQGRNLELAPSAVKRLVQQLGMEAPVFQPEKASDPCFLQNLEQMQADLFVVVAYGQILSRRLLAIPRMGCINVHASLLPQYRGAAPIQRCLMNGDTKTGISIQKMVYQLDAGDVIAQDFCPVDLEMRFSDLERLLCELSKPLLLSVIRQYQAGEIPNARPQDEAQVTLAPKIAAEETLIQWDWDATRLHNLVRALSPRPGAWCWVDNGGRKRLKILRANVSPLNGIPGDVLRFEKSLCVIAAHNGALQLTEVQPEGKKAMTAADWIRGCTVIPHFL